MKTRTLCRLAISAAVLLVALPTLAVVERQDYLEPQLRLELVLPDPPLQTEGAAFVFEDPHDGDPGRNDRDDLIDPRVDLPDRLDNMLEDLRIERDGRPNLDGSPRLKDLNPGPRQR